MKKILLSIALLCISYTNFAQAKKPKLMVVPSTIWCKEHGYYTEIDKFGVKEQIPNYQKAYESNHDLYNANAQISALLQDRGFPVEDFLASLNALNQGSSEDMAMNMDREGKGKSTITESQLDKVKTRVKADIIIELDWEVITIGPKKRISYTMRGLDAYSGKQIAKGGDIGDESISSPIPVLLREVVLKSIDNFNARLQAHFEDLFTNGREIKVEIRKWENWDKDFETEYNNEELNVLLKDWMSKNTVKGRFTTVQSTETKIVYDQVRIPMYNDSKTAIDAEDFGRQIKKFLKAAPFTIESKIDARGLGWVIIICGSK